MKFSVPWKTSIAAAGFCLATAVSPVFASPMISTMHQDNVVYNGQIVLHPVGYVVGGTTYMSVTDITQVLEQLNVEHAWNGGTLWIGSPMSYSPVQHPEQSPMVDIRTKDAEVVSVPRLMLATTPQGQTDTFLPIWYVMKTLQGMGVTSHWDGSTWTLTTQS